MRRMSSTWRKYSIAGYLIMKWSTWCTGRVMDWIMLLGSPGRIWSVIMWKIKSGSSIDDTQKSQEYLDASFNYWNWIHPWGRYHCWIIGNTRAVLSMVALVLGRTFWNVTHWRRVMSHMEAMAGQWYGRSGMYIGVLYIVCPLGKMRPK